MLPCSDAPVSVHPHWAGRCEVQNRRTFLAAPSQRHEDPCLAKAFSVSQAVYLMEYITAVLGPLFALPDAGQAVTLPK